MITKNPFAMFHSKNLTTLQPTISYDKLHYVITALFATKIVSQKRRPNIWHKKISYTFANLWDRKFSQLYNNTFHTHSH